MSTNMMLMGVVQCFGSVAVWILAKCFGRRYTSFIVALLASVMALGITVTYFAATTSTFQTAQSILALTCSFFAASWVSVILFTLETFPTVLRGVAYGFVSCC